MVHIPLFLSWDSLFASCLAGLSQRSQGRQLRLAAAFGIADGVASMLATSPIIAHALPDWIRQANPSVVVWIYVAAMLVLPSLTRSNRIHGLVYVVPILFSLDNLLTPQADAPPIFAALLLGISSAVMSLAGFSVARVINKTSRKMFGSREGVLELPS
jgi:hypothetical protein